MKSEIPEFGRRIPGISYRDRPGAYGIVINVEGKVAVVKASAGCFLPGGGIEAGESAEIALICEAREECGWDIIVLEKCAEAVQYVHAPGEGYFAKQSAFYRFNILQGVRGNVEDNHETLWLEVVEAQKRLKHESQSWAVAQAFRG